MNQTGDGGDSSEQFFPLLGLKTAKVILPEVGAVPLPGENPELEYQVRRKHKRLSPAQQKKLVSSNPMDGPGSYGGGGVSSGGIY